MPTSIHLDPETEVLLARLARSSGRTKSEVIREALHRMSEDAHVGEPASLFHGIEDLVGSADVGPGDLARHHKQRFRENPDRRRKK